MPPIPPARYHRVLATAVAAAGLALGAGCAADAAPSEALTASVLDDRPGADSTAPVSVLEGSVAPSPSSIPAPSPATTGDDPGATPDAARRAPDWLGRRTLPTRPDGVALPQPTPPELRDRRFVTVDRLPPPAGDRFESTIGPVEPEVLARSTWEPGCPVEPEDLAYLTLSHWGFDGEAHTGEMIVNREVAVDVVGVFERLFAARFPIEEMRVVSAEDLAAPPTGDGNNTTAFVCRPVIGGTAFSEHASGLAVDINPFHNPYRRGEVVLPELAGHYLDRSIGQPGMIADGDVVVEAFAAIGWSWGGNWRSLEDYHHFSHNGR